MDWEKRLWLTWEVKESCGKERLQKEREGRKKEEEEWAAWEGMVGRAKEIGEERERERERKKDLQREGERQGEGEVGGTGEEGERGQSAPVQ